ncbi:dienelactone hydrolase family protein [Amycolatopsis pithecellobii]|uniref:Dienelactone hydrolase n=1 Tax=Amycolatopsis pithecellobii TaxID=664692 RepID=A0A6N7Z8V6_9PSEU|nr:dienelactone hydrolase family protein [Amycolatopsis pithecellobii]MTD57186.1 dienelactone hydrolase [Amycolatopsis pithecellobii]
MTTATETGTVSVGELNAYLARPAGGSARGMLLLPMITGIGAQLRDWADELAARGVTALVWDPFHGVSSDDTSIEELMGLMQKFDDETCLAEQRALLDHLFGELGCTKAGVMGWCLGGRFALLLGGVDNRVANVVAYHPTVPGTPAPNHTLDAAEHTGRIEAPALLIYPGADTLVPVESFNRLQAALESREHGATFVQLFPHAEHGFSAKARQENPVNAEAFALSWPQALALIDTTTAA